MKEKIKILFLIHDLGQGGAEKVLVNLVNNMNLEKFDITVMALFGGGVNEQFLKPHIRYKTVFRHMFPGNSHVLKLFSPEWLHKRLIKEKYDIEVSYLEGPSARIISGCGNKETKLVSWIHCTMKTEQEIAVGFRNYEEAKRCYDCFHNTVCVSESVKEDFCRILDFRKPIEVLYNTVESEKIKELSKENVKDYFGNGNQIRMIAVGTLKESKGYERLLRVMKRIKEEHNVHLYILGEGPLKEKLNNYIREHDLDNSVTLLGYHTNPYKFIANCDLLVCASYAEGFSTAATEALIVGTPVCTVEVSGMKEMLGENNEYGVVVENEEEALYQGIKGLLDDNNRMEHYKRQAVERGMKFSTKNTVDEVEKFLCRLNLNRCNAL